MLRADKPVPEKPCIVFNTAGVEVAVGLLCITVMAVVAIVVMKEAAKDIIISAVSVMGGWLGKTAVDAIRTPEQPKEVK